MERKMKVWIVLMATWLCSWSIHTVESASKACPKKAINGNNNIILGYNTVSLNVDDATAETYSIFLSNFRNEVKSDELSYGIPILCQRSKVVEGMEYVLVDLTYNNHTITLAIDVVILYFVAYKADTTSYFFQEFSSLKSVLFQDTTQVDLPYTGSYSDLTPRQDVDLGKYALGDAIDALYKYDDQGKVKPGLVTVIEMVAEAARFSLIQRTLEANFSQSIRPGWDIISYESNWGRLSKAIQRSSNGDFPPIKLQYADGSPKEVTEVWQVEQDMALLLFATTNHNEETSPIDELKSVM